MLGQTIKPGGGASGSEVSFLHVVGGGSGGGAGAASGGASDGGSGLTFGTRPDLIGNPRLLDTRVGEDELHRVQDAYTQEYRDHLVGQIYGEGGRQLEGARSPEQQQGNYAYYDWNLGKENPRGNLNARTYESTLRMSRLADAVNNRLHWDPGTAATIMTANGPSTLGQGTGNVGKWEPMETQEMRQMRANERVDERARNAGVDLQSRIQAYPQDIQEAMDKSARDLRYYISQMDDQTIRNWQQTVLNTEYAGSWNNYFHEKLQEYLNELKLHTDSRIYRMLEGLAPNIQQQLAAIFGKHQFVPMSEIQQYLMQLKLQYYNLPDSVLSPQEKALTGQMIDDMIGILANDMRFRSTGAMFFGGSPRLSGGEGGSGSRVDGGMSTYYATRDRVYNPR